MQKLISYENMSTIIVSPTACLIINTKKTVDNKTKSVTLFSTIMQPKPCLFCYQPIKKELTMSGCGLVSFWFMGNISDCFVSKSNGVESLAMD